MRTVTTAALFIIAGMSSAHAQMTAPGTSVSPPATSAPGNNAINAPDKPNATAPVAGANSFTESQAKMRIESNGFTNVTDLKKDDSGVWRGKAMKAGQSQTVSVDFQGNVVAR